MNQTAPQLTHEVGSIRQVWGNLLMHCCFCLFINSIKQMCLLVIFWHIDRTLLLADICHVKFRRPAKDTRWRSPTVQLPVHCRLFGLLMSWKWHLNHSFFKCVTDLKWRMFHGLVRLNFARSRINYDKNKRNNNIKNNSISTLKSHSSILPTSNKKDFQIGLKISLDSQTNQVINF